ncbi:MAG: sigma 54-interacting transcriptional regulator [Deltaproteobacteria bacterium]|jgi:PAS domain S-box-containing protein|nr:sigma 54-interacting transcriptional regulator [Deltaproteobacteria bacterium]
MKKEKNIAVCGNSILCNQWLDILDELNIGAFTVDNRRQVSSMNHSAQALIGLRDTEAIGKDCREVFVGVPCLAECPFKGAGLPSTEEPVIQIQDEDQNTHLVTRMASPVFGLDHQVVGCMTILQDHSPIADLIDRIHYEEQSLKIILDNLELGIFTVDRSGHITFYNTEAEKISGYNRREVLGEPCTAIFEGEGAQEVCLLKDTIVDGISRSSAQGNMTTRDGVTIPIRANYMALRNEKGTVVGGLTTFHDLTLVLQLKQAMKDRYSFHDLIGKSPRMRHIFEMVNVVASTDATILIEGATGTGKDLLAKVIHSTSRRSNNPFVKVNCAAIPDNLLESEMFGYVKGAFTGAEKDKSGRFQEADGGTIFLDEIGDLPLALQAKLLRVLEDKEFYRLGSRHTVKVNVRIISASNRNLDKLVKKRLFREDLYYRLNVFRIVLPELKARQVDLPLLIGHILRRLCAARGARLPEVSEKVMKILLNYHYPGNVRELENILEHSLIICQERTVQPRHLPEYLQVYHAPSQAAPAGRRRHSDDSDEKERQILISMLQHHNWHRSKTAKALGMDRTTLWRKIKKYGIVN